MHMTVDYYTNMFICMYNTLQHHVTLHLLIYITAQYITYIIKKGYKRINKSHTTVWLFLTDKSFTKSKATWTSFTCSWHLHKLKDIEYSKYSNTNYVNTEWSNSNIHSCNRTLLTWILVDKDIT